MQAESSTVVGMFGALGKGRQAPQTHVRNVEGMRQKSPDEGSGIRISQGLRLCQIESTRTSIGHFGFEYSALACFRMGMSGSTSFLRAGLHDNQRHFPSDLTTEIRNFSTATRCYPRSDLEMPGTYHRATVEVGTRLAPKSGSVMVLPCPTAKREPR